jgi:hypothetical protein
MTDSVLLLIAILGGTIIFDMFFTNVNKQTRKMDDDSDQ